MIPNGDPQGWFFYPILTLVIDSYTIIYVRMGWKNLSLGITICHHLANLVMQNGDPQDILTLMKHSFHIYFRSGWKKPCTVISVRWCVIKNVWRNVKDRHSVQCKIQYLPIQYCYEQLQTWSDRQIVCIWETNFIFHMFMKEWRT